MASPPPGDGALEPLALAEPTVYRRDAPVRGHDAEDLRRRQRARRVLVAPPEYRLGPPLHVHPPVVAEHPPGLGVHPSLYAVVGRVERTVGRQGGVQVGEQRPRRDEPRERPPGLDQALVRPDAPAALVDGGLREEARPAPAPVEVGRRPRVRLARRLHRQEGLGNPVELCAGLEVRAARGVPPDLAERVEDAPLHASGRPLAPQRLGQPVPAVRHRHLGRSDAGDQRRPRPGVPVAAQVPAEDGVVGAGDGDASPATQVDPVEADDAVALLDPGRHGPDLPERPGPAPGRPAPSGHRRLRLPGEQPGEEGGERLRGGVHPMGGAGAAGLAPPSLAPGAGPAVSPRLSAAEGTGLRVHRMPPSSRTSSTVSAWTSWPNARLRTHFLSILGVGARQLLPMIFVRLPGSMGSLRTHILSYNPLFTHIAAALIVESTKQARRFWHLTCMFRWSQQSDSN